MTKNQRSSPHTFAAGLAFCAGLTAMLVLTLPTLRVSVMQLMGATTSMGFSTSPGSCALTWVDVLAGKTCSTSTFVSTGTDSSEASFQCDDGADNDGDGRTDFPMDPGCTSNAHEGKIDMASVPRQPGSSFKPFVYAKAFEQGYGPGTVIYDVSTKIGDDEPQNYDGTFLGLMTMRTALAFSRNIPAAKTFFLAGGEDAILSLVESMGVKTPTTFKAQVKLKNPDFEYGWPLAIGAAEAPLTEMVQGFATFADGGRYRPPVMILKITDRQGNILYQHKEENDTQVLDPRIAAEITSILSDPNARPPNEFWRAQLSLPVAAAAKTGTSNKCLERNQTGSCTSRRPESNWTMGYTSNLVTGVWVGNATSASLAQKADGLSTAAPIWHEFMTKAIALHPGAGPFPLPDGIAQPQISLLSGKLPTECTPVPLRRSDLFLEENIPTEEDPACQMLKVDKVTGLLASASCPADAVEEHAFFVPSSELPKRFPSWEQSVQEWAKRQMDLWNATEDHSGSLLPLPLAPTEQCDVAKTPGRAEKPMLHILAPSANAAVSYPAFDVELQVQSTAAIKEIRFAIDGKTVRTVENIANTTIPIRVPRSVDRNGPHTLTVTLVNEYFTEASASTAFTFEP
jgi:membrane carboxypeptidase/penicillin-binding protein PbpC